MVCSGTRQYSSVTSGEGVPSKVEQTFSLLDEQAGRLLHLWGPQ